jgi:hypothetical protein
MNLLIALSIAWVFSFAEDVMANRELEGFLTSEANKKELNAEKSIKFFRENQKPYYWLILALGLSTIIFSFPHQFSISIHGGLFFAGVCACIFYITILVRNYTIAAKILNSNELR